MTIDQITSIQQAISEHKGYCEVPSASDSSKSYRVYVNSKLYSVSCNCRAGQNNQDCGHRVAVDRFYDSRRKSQPKGVVVWTQKPVYCDESDDPFINAALREQQRKDEERTRYLNYLLSIGA